LELRIQDKDKGLKYRGAKRDGRIAIDKSRLGKVIGIR